MRSSSWLDRLLAGPDLPEPERLQRSTRTFLLIALVFSGGLYLIGRLLNPGDPIVPAALMTTLIIAGGLVLALLGFIAPARIVPPAAVLAAVFYLMYTGQGLHDIAISGFGITLAFAGLMLGRRGPLAFSLLSALGITLFGYAEMTGRLQYSVGSGWFEVAAISLTTIGAGVFLYLLLNQYERTLERVRRNEQEQARINRELRELKEGLELRVAERTASLERRGRELEAAAQVARESVLAQDPQSLLNRTVEMIAERFGYYFVGIYLPDPTGEQLNLTVASSDRGRRMVERGQSIRIGLQDVVGSVAATRRPRIIPDTNREPGYLRHAELPLSRSEMALPLIGRAGLIGVLDVQSTEANAFQNEDLEILSTLADVIGGAIQNARLLTESRALIEQLEAMAARQARKAWREKIGKAGLRVTFSAAGVTSQAAEHARPGHTARLAPRRRADIPLTVRGQRIGRISLFREENAPAWSEEDKSTAAEIARQVGLALENARLTEEARQRAAREQLISSISGRMRETLDLETVLRTATQEMLSAFDLKEVEIRLGQPEKGAK